MRKEGEGLEFTDVDARAGLEWTLAGLAIGMTGWNFCVFTFALADAV